MKLLNFLKKPITVETDVMEAVNPSYPKIVQEIHDEFMSAGDKVLAQAKEIIANAKITNEQKSNQLESLGFRSTKEVIEAQLVKDKRAEQEKIATAITDMQQLFPNNKVITEEIIEKICNKYSLIFGEVGQYKGFVPQKNADDIARFYKNHPEEEVEYVRQWLGIMSRFDSIDIVSKSDYESAIAITELSRKHNMTNQYNFRYYKRTPKLNICAPLKDMNTNGYKVKGHLLVKNIPDPIVTKLKIHENGTKVHIILTAWGDEASDPMVTNEKLN